MTIPSSGPAPLSPRPLSAEDAKLRETARQLEGLFVEQLFKAMRETVPEGGLTDGGAGEEVFSALMDQHLAGAAASKWDRGVGAALYRQLQQRAQAVELQGNEATPAPASPEVRS